MRFKLIFLSAFVFSITTTIVLGQTNHGTEEGNDCHTPQYVTEINSCD